ncbi:hypothetical protein TREES_T100019230 [Tupaia chinensis]|uniref:Uncharacterized protein n=1 Tax=Tupaia chinensis TaxID=246437 RepID=L9L9Q3_TUPCH|nr:hypothetical protein TREES_T100019230 [Tupaia chinensis]
MVVGTRVIRESEVVSSEETSVLNASAEVMRDVSVVSVAVVAVMVGAEDALIEEVVEAIDVVERRAELTITAGAAVLMLPMVEETAVEVVVVVEEDVGRVVDTAEVVLGIAVDEIEKTVVLVGSCEELEGTDIVAEVEMDCVVAKEDEVVKVTRTGLVAVADVLEKGVVVGAICVVLAVAEVLVAAHVIMATGVVVEEGIEVAMVVADVVAEDVKIWAMVGTAVLMTELGVTSCLVKGKEGMIMVEGKLGVPSVVVWGSEVGTGADDTAVRVVTEVSGSYSMVVSSNVLEFIIVMSSVVASVLGIVSAEAAVVSSEVLE